MLLSKHDALSRCHFFSFLSVKDRQRLACFAVRRVLKAGEHVYAEGELIQNVWLVESGWVRLFKTSLVGKPIVLGISLPGEMFGPIVGRIHSSGAISDFPSTILGFPIERLSFFLRRYRDSTYHLLQDMDRRLQEAHALHSMLGEPLEVRAAVAILFLQRKFGSRLAFSRQALAELLNVTRESVARTLARFQRMGIIKIGRQTIFILKPHYLQFLANGYQSESS